MADETHSHGHDHGHAHEPPKTLGALGFAFILTFVIFLVELAGGLWTRSLALVADAMHMAVDLAALGIGLFAAWMAAKPADEKRTYGYYRVEVLAALANGVGLTIIAGVLLHEAWDRFHSPAEVRVLQMLGIAVVGLVANLVSGLVLHRHSRANINVRGVFLHVLSDALGSVGAIAAGLVMWKTGWMPADPAATVFICCIIAFGAYRLMSDSIHILMEGTPEHLSLDKVRKALLSIEGVTEVHDLHLWQVSSGKDSMSAHIVIAPKLDSQVVLKKAAAALEQCYGFAHATLQIEKGKRIC